MKTLIIIAYIFFLTACQIKVERTDAWSAYFDEKTRATFLKAIDLYGKQDYNNADSLFTIVINNSRHKIDDRLPMGLNPYYFRGHLGLELNKYQRAIDDMGHVASDTTTNTDILLVRAESFRMLKQYDTAIVLANRLLVLGIDSIAILSLRGACYYRKGVMDKACSDLKISRELGGDTSYLNQFLKDCK